MKSRDIKKHVKDHYQAQTLSDEKMQRLMNMANPSIEENSTKNTSWFGVFIAQQKIALVASFMVIVVSFWGFTHFEQNKMFKDNFTQIVAQEIALNHSKQLNLDFNEIDYANLNKLMHKLDFQVVKSNHINLAGLEVLGARYCTIQGNIAAQIRLRDDSGKIFTLYQTKLTSMLNNNFEDTIQSIDQVDVKQWQENDLFFGLAVSIDSAS